MSHNHPHDDRRIVGVRRTWLTVDQAESLKLCFTNLKSFHIRALVDSEDQAHHAYEGFMCFRQQLMMAIASLNLRIAERSKKHDERMGGPKA